MRAAVYAGTRNLYKGMVTAAKSLIRNSRVDKVYFLIEDDAFPCELPPIVETINVKHQTYFPKNGANYRTSFTYMSLLRVCYAKLFPTLDKVLQLDVDTVVVDNIDYLWDVPLGEAYFAAVEEKLSKYKPFGKKYYNIGVAMFNLDRIRETHIDDRLIQYLNNIKTPYIDQDAWNLYGAKTALALPVRHNESFVTGYTDSPAIVHFAGFKEWETNPRVCRREYLKKYQEMPWEEVLHDFDNCSDI